LALTLPTSAGRLLGQYSSLADYRPRGLFCFVCFNTTFENVVKLEYFGMTVTNQSLIQGKMMSRLNLVNAYYHSVQGLLSSCLLSKNIKIKKLQNY
jgi:hypothetical protein